VANVDAWGRVILGEDAWLDVLYAGGRASDFLIADDDAGRAYNALCERFQAPDEAAVVASPLAHSPEAEHARRAATWHIPDEMLTIDVRAFILSMCTGAAEIERCETEMDMFEARGLIPVLQTMIYAIDNFRTRGIVWGVGRGSSVSSYVLFKIGVHKIDALKYNLDITEFLK
jgi:hypothetical protein